MTPANNDLNTGEAYSIAKNADPESRRTLTIATKIDTREKQTFANQFKLMSSGLGVVCVRCRTNHEVETEKISFQELMLRERQCLLEDDLVNLPSSSKGTPKLIEQLIGLQREMLMANKPVLKKELDQARREAAKELQAMPKAFSTI